MNMAMETQTALPADSIELTVVMPCLNEAKTIGPCITQCIDTMTAHGIIGEVIVADNGSTDNSREIATKLGARVVEIPRKGYGSALMGGIAAARGRYVIMGDSDQSYDFSHIPRFMDKLREGWDLVMGNRFKGGIKPGAMPPLHRYLGNPVLTGIGRLFFHCPSRDFHCGLRGFSKAAAEKMDLRSTGMEFASEMVIKATLMGMRVTEIPTTLSPDGRDRAPHLRSWRDGWRHLRFMLLFSPRWLFFYPGMALICVGLIAGLWLLPGPRSIGSVTFDIHTLFYASTAVLVGFQAVAFAIFSKIFAISEGLLPKDPGFEKIFRYVNLEVGLVTGAIVFLAGLGLSIAGTAIWRAHDFGPLSTIQTFRIVIPAGLLLVLGCQIIFSSFFLSVLGLSRR